MAIADPAASVSFREGFVEADGFNVRFLEAGAGEPLIVLHGGGGLRHYASHDLLAQSHRVILFEAPGFGASPANERTQSMAELANTMAQAVRNLGIERYDLQGTSFGGKLAAWLAVQHEESIKSLVLVSSAALRAAPAAGQDGPPSNLLLYAHPERVTPQVQHPPEVLAKQRALTGRLIGPPRDAELEARLAKLSIPVLVIFGTLDHFIPAELMSAYRGLLPNGNTVFVYDAAHEVDADRPEAFVALVNDFYDRHEAFLVNVQSSALYEQ
jgi:pimeloyl-ACP methyl ester carboxylesterase